MSYCWKCGVKLKEEDKSCHACGASVTKTVKEELSVSADNLIKKVKELLHEGNVTRIIIKDEKGRVLLEIPATVGVVGVVLAPWLAALGVITVLVTNCGIIVERREWNFPQTRARAERPSFWISLMCGSRLKIASKIRSVKPFTRVLT